MAITRANNFIKWSTANSLTVSSATEVVSDTFTVDDTCTVFALQLSADNQGTPASGDTAVFRIRWTTGDILEDGGGDDDFDTAEHAQHLFTLDTFATNTPGEDPARRTVVLDAVPKKFQIACICANAATRNVIIRARVEEIRVA